MYKRRHQIGLPFYLPGAVIAAVPAWLLTNWFHDTKAGTALGPFREFDREILRREVPLCSFDRISPQVYGPAHVRLERGDESTHTRLR